jgi:hypothetical protein
MARQTERAVRLPLPARASRVILILRDLLYHPVVASLFAENRFPLFGAMR